MYYLASCLASVFMGACGFDELVSCGEVVRVIDLLVGDVPPLSKDRLLV